MNINKFKENYIATNNKYISLVKEDKFIRIENFSLDFMMQNGLSFDEFRKAILYFRESFNKIKWLNLDGVSIELKEISVTKAYKISIPKIADSKNQESAKFSEEEKIDLWMKGQINNLLKQNVIVEIIPGLVIYKEKDKFEVAFKREFMER